MTLQELLERRKLAPKETTAQEVGDLMHLAEQYLADAQVETISPDLRFTAAYQAALQLATIPLHCAGYRPVGDGRHITVFQALPLVMGEEYNAAAAYYDVCRRKRHEAEYRRVGQISEHEVSELVSAVGDFLSAVREWLAVNHPNLLGEQADSGL